MDARGRGVRGALRGRLTYDVSAFGLRYDNRFGAVVRSDGAAAPYLFKTNVGSSLTRGVEVAPDAPLVITSRLAVNAFTATSFFDARYRAGSVVADGRNVSIEGKRVEGVPRWISRSGLAVRGGRLSASGTMSWVSESFYSGPGIWTSDGRGVQFSAELTFGLRAMPGRHPRQGTPGDDRRGPLRCATR